MTLRNALTIRLLMVLVALSALGSWGLERVLARRDFHARETKSRALLRPIIAHHETWIHSDSICSRSNGGTAMGHLSRSIGYTGKAIRALWLDFADLRHARTKPRRGLTAQDSLMYARVEWDYAKASSRLTRKQQLMVPYRVHLRDYYLGLLAEHRVSLPPLPRELEVERAVLLSELKRVDHNPKLMLDPEPLPEFLPGWKPPAGRPTAWIGDSL